MFLGVYFNLRSYSRVKKFKPSYLHKRDLIFSLAWRVGISIKNEVYMILDGIDS